MNTTKPACLPACVCVCVCQVRLNHVGDWGTQFGMLITYLKAEVPSALAADGAMVDLGDLVVLYKKAKVKFDQDAAFATASREAVVALQVGPRARVNGGV